MQGLMQSYPLTLDHLFQRAERLFGDKSIATAGPGGLDRTTYGEWAERTRRLGGVLDSLGISADGRVGTFAWNTARHLELYFAAPCSGRVLHTLNIRLFPEQLHFVADHADDEVIFADRSLLKLLWPLIDELPSVKHVVVMDDGAGEIPDDARIRDYEELLAAAEPVDFHVADEDSAAAMCYTSGTTGNPKGVVYSHRSTVLHSLGAMLVDTLAVSERDTILPVVPMFHANAWGLAQAGLLAGSSFVLPGPDLSPRAIATLMESERVTLAAGVPTIWMGVLDELDGRDLSALRAIVCGGSAVPRSLSEALPREDRHADPAGVGHDRDEPARLRRPPPQHAAGPRRVREGRRSRHAGHPDPAGRHPDRRAPRPAQEQPWDGEARGELQCAGPWIAAGYFGGDGATQFTDDGWLRTGDVAVISPDGYIKLVDRTKDLVKSGGEWISSVELENEIMAHPKVKEAAVIGIRDEKWGERPLACVVPEHGADLKADDIRAFLDGRVAKWWIPESIEFIEEVPKTSVGKFSKKTLREQFSEVAT